MALVRLRQCLYLACCSLHARAGGISGPLSALLFVLVVCFSCGSTGCAGNHAI
jgi:hypothetical protein